MQIKNNPAVLIHCFFADHLPWLLNWRNTNIKLFMVKDEFTQNNLKLHVVKEALPSGSDGKASAMPRLGFDPWVGKIPRRRKWQPAPVFLPRKSHGPRSLVSYRPWGRKELDTTERLHFHFHFTPTLEADSLPSESPGKPPPANLVGQK